MITGTFQTGAGVVTVEVDAGTATGNITGIGNLVYEFDITPDGISVDRLMAVYSRLNVTWMLYSREGLDLYELFSGGGDVLVTVAKWDGTTDLFGFKLEPQDVAIDERSATVRTFFSLRTDATVTVEDVFAGIGVGAKFNFVRETDAAALEDYEGAHPVAFIQEAMNQVFGAWVTGQVFASYPTTGTAYLGAMYAPIDVTDTAQNGKFAYLCASPTIPMTSSSLTIDGVQALDIPAIEALQSLAAFEGGVFGSGFSRHFYVNRMDDTDNVTLTFRDIIDLKFERNFKAFRDIRVANIQSGANVYAPTTYQFPNLIADDEVLEAVNPNAEKSVDIAIRAGRPVLNIGRIDTTAGEVYGQGTGFGIADVGLMAQALRGALQGYSRSLPAIGALKVGVDVFGWGKVKPWQVFRFDITVPERYQGRKFRIVSAVYDVMGDTTELQGYEIASFLSVYDAYVARVTAIPLTLYRETEAKRALFAWYRLWKSPVLVTGNAFSDTSGAINIWGSVVGPDGTSTGTSRPTLVSGIPDFDGSNDFIEIPHNANQLLTTGGTIMAWIRPDTIPSSTTQNDGARIIDKTNGLSAQNGYNMLVFGSNRVGFRINNGTNRAISNVLTTGEWQHIAVTFTDAGVPTFYVNGVSVGTTAATGAASGITTTNAMRIGNRATATDRPFDGLISDVLVSNSQWTASEIASYYAATQANYL